MEAAPARSSFPPTMATRFLRHHLVKPERTSPDHRRWRIIPPVRRRHPSDALLDRVPPHEACGHFRHTAWARSFLSIPPAAPAEAGIAYAAFLAVQKYDA